MHKKKAFLLLEAIIVLFILSLIVIPWYGFIRAIKSNQDNSKLNDYFSTKEVFLRAYNGEISLGTHNIDGQSFFVGKEDGKLFVRLMDGSIVKEEILGSYK